MTDLPGTVHLVSEAPQLDVVGRRDAVTTTQVGVSRAGRVVAVLHDVARRVDPARAKVDGHHRLAAHLAGPRHELVDTNVVGLEGSPRQLEPRRPLVSGTDAVLPVVAGDEVASGIAQDRRAELADEILDVGPEAVRIGRGVPRLIDAFVDTSAEVLDERAVDPGIDLSDLERRVDRQLRVAHLCSFHSESTTVSQAWSALEPGARHALDDASLEQQEDGNERERAENR